MNPVGEMTSILTTLEFRRHTGKSMLLVVLASNISHSTGLVFCFVSQAQFKEQHFDQDLNFCAIEEDPVTKKVRFHI